LDVETNEIKQVGERYIIYPPTSEPFPPILLDHLLSNLPTTQPLLLDWPFFRAKLQDVMTTLVRTRYREWYYGRQKKQGDDPKDQDYEEKEKEEVEEEEGEEEVREAKKRRPSGGERSNGQKTKIE
jgi:hypothetical protein